MKTELKDRTLWFDGTSQVPPELVPELLALGVPPESIIVTHLNEDVKQFNQFSEDAQILSEKSENRRYELRYQIPSKYLALNVNDELLEDLWAYINKTKIPTELHQKYVERFQAELDEINKRSMTLLVRTLMYVVDTFEKKKVLWGVGRGSSCASLLLLVLGLHCVDPIKYSIPMEEFFHD